MVFKELRLDGIYNIALQSSKKSIFLNFIKILYNSMIWKLVKKWNENGWKISFVIQLILFAVFWFRWGAARRCAGCCNLIILSSSGNPRITIRSWISCRLSSQHFPSSVELIPHLFKFRVVIRYFRTRCPIQISDMSNWIIVNRVEMI